MYRHVYSMSNLHNVCVCVCVENVYNIVAFHSVGTLLDFRFVFCNSVCVCVCVRACYVC